WQSSRPASRKLEIFNEHIRLFAARAANIGRGAALLASRFSPPQRNGKSPAILQNGGFSDAGGPALTPDQLRRIHASLDELHSRAWPAAALRPIFAAALRDLIGDVRRAGIEPV